MGLNAAERELIERRQGPVHAFFGLSYAAYFIVPRLSLQEMPVEWQERFVALMNEASQEHGLTTRTYDVIKRRGPKGRLTSDPFANYRHGSVKQAKAAEKALGLVVTE